MTTLAWMAWGIIATRVAIWSAKLIFGSGKLTLGFLIAATLGIILPPISTLCGIVWFLCWAFGDPDILPGATPWSPQWRAFRYRQHRMWMYVWHLGNPPEREDWLSAWHNTSEAIEAQRKGPNG